MGQVGGPEDAGACALVELDGDRKLRLRDIGVGGGLVELRGATAIAADGQFAKADVDALGVDLRAGVADGRHQTAPVGVAAGPGGLDQRRMGDGLGNLERVRICGRSLDAQLHNMRDALAVGHNLAGQRGADLGQGGGKRCVFRADDGARWRPRPAAERCRWSRCRRPPRCG